MQRIVDWLRLIAEHPGAFLRALRRDRTIDALLTLGTLLLFAHLLGGSFSVNLDFDRVRLEMALKDAEMPPSQIAAISGILDAAAERARTFAVWLVVIGGIFILSSTYDRIDRMTHRQSMEPTPEAWKPRKLREKSQ